MDDILEKIVSQIKKECPRRFRDLRQSCDSFLAKDQMEGRVFSIEPFVLACDTHHPRLMEVALEGFHFMIEHGFLNALKDERAVSDEEASILSTAIIEAVCKCSEEYDETVQLQVIKTLLVAVTSLQFEIHDANLLLAVRACFQIHLTSKNQIIKTTAKAALTQMISIIFQRMESYDGRNASSSPDEKFVDSTNKEDCRSSESMKNSSGVSISVAGETFGKSEESFDSPYQKDAYLLFRALCKLSTKGFQDESANSTDAVIHQNKVLSLELILVLLRNSGPLFKASVKFVNAVKTFLCNSLLSNCTSSSSQVTGLALQIFIVLVHDFKEHLKAEMEVFISSIFIRIIESEYSTYDHKARVLEVLHLIFTDSQAQLELFVNYDCDLNATNIFSRIVTSLARLAKVSGLYVTKCFIYLNLTLLLESGEFLE
jgi:brefeldin A-inhibited guanine nucleotide-exchange protein